MSKNKQSRISKFNKQVAEQGKFKLALLFIAFVIIRILFVDYKYFSYSLIPFIIGLFYQSYKVLDDINEVKEYFKTTVLITTYIAFPLLIFALIPMFFGNPQKKFEILDLYTIMIPYIYFGFYILIITAANWDKLTKKNTEGITLLLTISFIYFCLKSKVFEETSFINTIKILICLIFTLHTLINAFTYKAITQKTGIFLSIWSTFIALVFSYTHIQNLLEKNISYNFEGVMLSLVNFFLLGTSAFYIAQNLLLLIHYLPGKQATIFSKEHLKQVKEANKFHYDRYSNVQVKIQDSTICVIFCILFFSLNSFSNFIPTQTVIWLAFLIFPVLITLKNKISIKNLS